MKRTASPRTRRTQADVEPRVSRLHRPDEMSLEEWQRRLRKQFAGEQPFRIENTLETGVGFFRQLEAALPAEADPGGNGGKSTVRRIEARQDADGSTFLAVPMPGREAVARFTDGLVALLRSMLP